MANIPTLQIPNVASGVGNLSMAPAGAVRIPKIATMPVLGREVFDGVGAGAIGLSRGVWEGAQFLNEFSDKMAAANDNAQFAAVDRKFSEAMAEFEVESSTLPPDKHLGVWQQKYVPKLQSLTENVRATPEGMSRIQNHFARQMATSAASVKVGANKQFLSEALRESDARIERLTTEGNYEEIYAQLAQDEKSGLRTTAERKTAEEKLKTSYTEQTVDQQMNEMASMGKATDIDAMAEDLRTAYETKSFDTKSFPQLNGKPALLRKAMDKFESVKREEMGRRYDEAVTRIANNEFGTPDELREEYEDELGPELFSKAAQLFTQTPEQIKQKLEVELPALRTAIETYDAATDAKAGSKEYDRLMAWVQTMPAGSQADTYDMLREKKREAKPKPSSVVQSFLDKEKQLFEQGEYGPIKNDDDWQAAKLLQGRVVDKFNNWVRANPKEASDPLKTSEAYNAIKTQVYQEDFGDDRQSNMRPPKPISPQELPKRILDDPRISTRDARIRPQDRSPLDDVQLPMGDGSWKVTAQTRDELRAPSTAGQRQVSLDFNDAAAPTARGVEIVIPHNATAEERAAAQAYVDQTAAWFRGKGIDVPAGKVLTQTGRGAKVSRFHTEPFYAKDSEAFEAMRQDPDGYAAILENTLGRISGVTFIAPHKKTDGGAQNDLYNERDFARSYLIPALQRRKGETQIARND